MFGFMSKYQISKQTEMHMTTISSQERMQRRELEARATYQENQINADRELALIAAGDAK